MQHPSEFLTDVSAAPRDNSTYPADLAWQSLRDPPLDWIPAVHFVDRHGALMGGADYPQEAHHFQVRRHSLWMDKLTFTHSQLIGVSYLGFSIYRPGENLLPVSGGLVDWNGKRLLVNLATGLAMPDTLPVTSGQGVNKQVNNGKGSGDGD